MAHKGLECPNPKCRYIPGTDGKNFRTIKTTGIKGKVIRAKVCPICGTDFLSEEVATSQPYYKRKFIERNLSNA